MRNALIILTAVLGASTASADFNFFGYGAELGIGPLLGSPAAQSALPGHADLGIDDRLIFVRQGEPLGLMIDAEFFGLSGLSYLAACGIEGGGACPGATGLFRGGVDPLIAVRSAITMDIDEWHPGLGLAFELADVAGTGAPRLVTGLGGNFSLGLSNLGFFYPQIDLSVVPLVDVGSQALVSVRTRAELSAVVALPFVALIGSAGYQAAIPADGFSSLDHGPYAKVGVLISVGTILDLAGFGWRTAGAATDLVMPKKKKD